MLGLDYRQKNRSSQTSLKKNDNYNKSKIKYQKQGTSMNKTTAEDFEKLLRIQIKNANDMIMKVKSEMQQLVNNQQKKQIIQLREIEEQIRRGNHSIKQIELQINYLKNHNKKISINPEDIKISLTEQIKTGLNEIIKLRRKIHEKRNLVSQKWQQVRLAQQQFAIKNKKDKKQIIDFQTFKQIQEKRRRQQIKNEKSVETSKKKQISTIWQSGREKGGLNSNNLKINSQNKTIRDFMIRKSVAENALKNEKKKHKQQMFNLTSKLEFLKDEESEIEMKIKSKSHELQGAQKKFSQTRNNLVSEQSLKKYKIQKLKTVD